MTAHLLGPGDPEPVEVLREQGASPFVLLADHAGRRIPASLNGLGVDPAALDRHIAWDIGIRGVTERLSALLDATAIMQRYSRLVIDCNRPDGAPSQIPEISDGTRIPGNNALDDAAIAARRAAIFAPYHGRIDGLLRARLAAGRPTALIAMHSFTPIFAGFARPWEIGTLYIRDDRLARGLIAWMRALGGLTVGDNEPYHASGTTDYAIPVHGEGLGIPVLGIEIRQDLVEDAAGQGVWAERLADALRVCWERVMPK